MDFYNTDEVRKEGNKIIINLLDSCDFLEFMSKNDKFRKIYLELLNRNYVYYRCFNNELYFMKRNDFLNNYHLIKNGELKRYKDIFYRLDHKEKNDKLIVIFSSNPTMNKFDEPSVYGRYFTQNFPGISNFLTQNTSILRIADFNRHVGSFYRNTINYKNYEEDIKNLILSIVKTNDISFDNVLIYGASKGGTAAINYGLELNFHFVAVDPICHLVKGDINRTNSMYLINSMDYELIKRNKIDEYSAFGKIIGSSNVNKNYLMIKERFNDSKIQIYNINLAEIKMHTDVAKHTKNLQLAFINSILNHSALDN